MVDSLPITTSGTFEPTKRARKETQNEGSQVFPHFSNFIYVFVYVSCKVFDACGFGRPVGRNVSSLGD